MAVVDAAEKISARSKIIVHAPGVRIEGLDGASLADLLRRLA